MQKGSAAAKLGGPSVGEPGDTNTTAEEGKIGTRMTSKHTPAAHGGTMHPVQRASIGVVGVVGDFREKGP